MARVVAWFSNGAASAVATRMALKKFGPSVVIANIDTGSEHKDNHRFQMDCERWFGHEILTLKSRTFRDIWDVFATTRYLNGPTGARCTGELKKKVRHAFELPDDLHVFGYTADPRDRQRAERFVVQNPGVDIWFPLIKEGLTKADTLSLVKAAKIVLPKMYRLGYVNNNCIGCVKGGMGYWNKIREDFPEVFARMAAQERDLGHTVLRSNGEPLFLDELEPGRGNYKAEMISSCDLDCQSVADEFEIPVVLGRKDG